MIKIRSLILMGVVLGLVTVGGGGCTKQVKRARHLSRANRYYEAGDYDKAEIEYLTVLRLPPPDPSAVSQLGLIYHAQGKRLSSYVYLREAVKLRPDDIQARLKLGSTCLWFHQIQQAREQATAVLQRQPDNPDALLLLADSALTPDYIRETSQTLQKVSAQAANQAGYHVALGTLYFRQNDLNKAEKEFQQALLNDPKSSLAHLGLGDAYAASNDLSKAEAELKTAAELSALRSPVRLRYAGFQLKIGKPKEAKAGVEDLLQKAPDYLPGWVFLAQLAQSEGKTSDCEALVQKILGRDRASYEGLMLNGNLMMAKGDATNASIQFERLVSAYGPGAQTEYALAVAQMLARQEGKAIASLNKSLAADTNFLQSIFLQATLNIRQGNGEAAVSSLLRLIRQQPQIQDAYTLLANAYIAQRKPDEAAGVYRTMSGIFTNNPEVPFALGALLNAQGKREEARQALENSIRIVPEFWPAVEALTDLDLRQDRGPAAMERIKKYIDKNPAAPMPWLLKAKIHMANALILAVDANRAATNNTRVLQVADVPATAEDVSQAEAALTKAIELNPDLPTGYEMLARVYVWSNKQQQALARLNALVSRTNDVTALTQIGMIHEQMHDYPAARDAYERVLKVDANAFEALNNLANLYSQRLGEPDRAYELAEKARRLRPTNPFADDTLGWIVYKRKDYARALALIEESARRLPNDLEVQYHLGMAHYMMGEAGPARLALGYASSSSKDFSGKDEAAACLALLEFDSKTAGGEANALIDKRLNDVPDDPIALECLARFHERDGDFDKATKTYEMAAKANPQNAQLKLKLAELYEQRMGDSSRALELAKEAHKIAPDDPQISHLLGRLAFSSKDYKWAASLLQDSARKLPDDPEVLYDLAWSYLSLGDVAQALSTMRTISNAAGAQSRRVGVEQFIDFTGASQDNNQAGQAESRAQKVLTMTPNYVPGLLVCAKAQERQNNHKQAAELYNRVLDQYPFFTPAARSLALLYFSQLGDGQRAYDLAAKARETFTDDPQLAKVLGVVSYRRQDYTRAAQLLEEGAGKLADDAEVFYYLGMARYRLNQRTQSKQQLQRSLALNSAASFSDEAKRVLQELK